MMEVLFCDDGDHHHPEHRRPGRKEGCSWQLLILIWKGGRVVEDD